MTHKNTHEPILAPAPSAHNSVSIENLPLPALLVSNAGHVLAANRSAAAVFGESQAGCHVATVVKDKKFLKLVSHATETNATAQCEIVTSGHAKRRFQASINPFHEEKRDGLFIAFYETTAAYEAEKMRSSFVADVSHELRSPLTTMIATIETLKGSAGSKPDVRARFVELLALETNRMHRIVDDLLSLSATEANEHIAPEDTVQIGPIVANIAEVLAMKAASKDMTIQLQIQPDMPDILGDSDELYQALYNLADNAIKYGSSGSDVILTAAFEDGFVQFQTHNWGSPIKEKHLPRLTERFYRADKSRSRDLGGTGLGLAIVKHIVNRHLGSLEITSSQEEGTVFSLKFPQR
ncbi:MAG: PAS domain-containing sensor histidine kinase [Kordiimonadales bacterium]|nr:MAG: PAS domain-containing sensor histidine kinase [Kordiimonadales bacterium]